MRKRLLLFCGVAWFSTATLFGQGLNPTQKKGDWEEVNFAFDRAVLTDGYPSLLRLAELLTQHRDYRVKLEGHADHLGPDSYNAALGRKRAETVRDFLVKYGTQTSQITIETFGEQSPTADNNLREGRWMNRRVKVTVTDAQGNIVSDGGVGEAITSLDDLMKAQEECCNKILKELEKLDDILAALKGLKNENDVLKGEVDKLKEGQREMETKMAAAPKPATETQVREIVREETPKIIREETPEPSKKFARYNLMAGPDTEQGNLAVSGSGQVFLPFAKRHAVQAQGEYMHNFRRDEGQVDLGIVNRFGPMQAGAFSSFKYVKFDEFSHSGALGQAAGTLDYIFPRGRVGIFGTKGFMDGSILNTRFLAPNRIEETYLSIVDQFGFSTAVAAWGDAWFEGNIGAQFRKFDDNKAGGRIRYIHPITDRLAFSVAGGLNETLISTNNTGSLTVGLEFGKWLSPKGYGETEGPVPVDVPRIRYEVLTRTIRTGNDVPVADAGPDQMGVEAGTISLDASGSSDPDDDPITFAWEQVGGPGITLSSPTAAQTTFTADEGKTYHFRLTVRDDQNGVGTDRVTVSTLDRQISILRFSAEPLRITTGDAATLVWEVRNATNVEISGIGEVDPAGGSSTVSPTDTTTYTLTASNPKRTLNQTVTVTVDPLPPIPDPDPPIIISFFASPPSIVRGNQSRLSWEVRNATDVTISGIGSVDRQDATPVMPDQTTTYTITARNDVGEASATATVTVREEPTGQGQVEILTFSAAPGQLAQAGDPTVLRWTTSNATKVVITGVGEVALSGEVTVNPTVDTTYTLNATDLDGTEATAVVLVTIETRNRAPVAIATADWMIRGDGAGTIGELNGSTSFDPDGDPITLIWRNVGDKAAEILDQGSERPRVRFTGGRGLYEFELEVVDDKGLRSFDRESLIVGDP